MSIMQQQHSGSVRVSRGDIVWARVQFPHRWWPALVLGSDELGVLVSFFNHKIISSPTYFYFVESEVVPFEETFPSLMDHHNTNYKCDTFYALLDSALRLLGQRVISSLRCRCQMGLKRVLHSGRKVLDELSNSCFEPTGLLGFVLKVAVLPWVDAPDFVHAVRVVAQIHAFRGFCSIKQKRVYREIPKTGDNVKLHPCSSLVQKMHSVTQESVALEPKDKYQTISKQGEKNIAIGALRKRKRLDIPALCDCFFTRQRILSFCSIHSHVKLKIQNLSSNQGLSVTCTCGNSWMNLRCGAACCMPLLKYASCHVFPQIGRVQESEGNAYMSKYTRPSISHIKMLEPEESIQKDNQACICFCETTMNFTGEVQTVDLKKSQNLTLQQSFTCESLSNLVLGFHSNNCEVDATAAKIEGILGSNSSVYQKRLQLRSDGDTASLKSEKSARIKLSSGDCLVEDKDRYQCVATCSIFNSKVGQRSKTHVPISSTSLFMKFPKNFNLPSKGELIKKFSVFGSVDSSKTRIFSYTGSAQVAFFNEADAVAAHLYGKEKKVRFGEANVRFWLDPFEHKRRGFKRFALMSPSASKPIGPLLKSCLKNSSSLR